MEFFHPSRTAWLPIYRAILHPRSNVIVFTQSSAVQSGHHWYLQTNCAFHPQRKHRITGTGLIPTQISSLTTSTPKWILCRDIRYNNSEDTLSPDKETNMCTTWVEPPLSQGVAWPAGEQSHLCLFAGVGGVATGIHHMMPNTKCHAVDNSQVELDLFQRRCPWTDTIQEDVSNMNWWKHACGSPPILVTLSPPCPPFSSAGLRKGLSDWRALVWRDALLLLHMLRPPLTIIENVHGITTSEKGALAAAIEARVSSFG